MTKLRLIFSLLFLLVPSQAFAQDMIPDLRSKVLQIETDPYDLANFSDYMILCVIAKKCFEPELPKSPSAEELLSCSSTFERFFGPEETARRDYRKINFDIQRKLLIPRLSGASKEEISNILQSNLDDWQLLIWSRPKGQAFSLAWVRSYGHAVLFLGEGEKNHLNLTFALKRLADCLEIEAKEILSPTQLDKTYEVQNARIQITEAVVPPNWFAILEEYAKFQFSTSDCAQDETIVIWVCE